MSTERCWRLANCKGTVDVRGDATRDAMIHLGYGLVSEISCSNGTVTAQADPEFVAQGKAERDVFALLPDDEKRALRRQVGGVVIEQSGQSVPWKES